MFLCIKKTLFRPEKLNKNLPDFLRFLRISKLAISVCRVFLGSFGRIKNENSKFVHVEYDAVVRFWKSLSLHHFTAAGIWTKSEKEKEKTSPAFGVALYGLGHHQSNPTEVLS